MTGLCDIYTKIWMERLWNVDANRIELQSATWNSLQFSISLLYKWNLILGAFFFVRIMLSLLEIWNPYSNKY